MVEYKKNMGSSGVAKTGLALGATALGLNLLGGGGILPNLFGQRPAYLPANGGVVTIDAAGTPVGGYHGGYVTEKEMCLIREGAAKDAVIAQLTAEKYSDNKNEQMRKEEIEPLKKQVCELEKLAAVNAARDFDFRRYVEGEFVHQPKAKMRQSIVTCTQCGCCDCCCKND